MSKSYVMARHLKRKTIQVEPFLSLDEQGKPSYDTPVDIDVRGLREDKMTQRPDGSIIQTNLTVWVPSDQTPLPGRQDRITYADNSGSDTFIVEHMKEVRNRFDELVHRRVRCRLE